MIQKLLSRTLAVFAAVALSLGLSVAQAKPATAGNVLAGGGPGFGANGVQVLQAPITNGYGVAGFESVDAQGSPLNVVGFAFLGAGAHVTGIGWDLNIETVGESWFSEAIIGFADLSQTTGVNLTAGIGDDFGGIKNYSSGGVVDLVGIALDFFVGADGNLRVEFFESFDDNFQSADARYLQGSALFIRYEIDAPDPSVPEPGTLALLALGLIGTSASRVKRSGWSTFRR